MSSLDIFSIIESRTVSFLSEDIKELCRLILKHGKRSAGNADSGPIPIGEIDLEKAILG